MNDSEHSQYEVHDREVFLLQLAAERQIRGCHDDRLGRHRRGRRRFVIDHVVRAVGEASARKDGDREDGKNSAAHS